MFQHEKHAQVCVAPKVDKSGHLQVFEGRAEDIYQKKIRKRGCETLWDRAIAVFCLGQLAPEQKKFEKDSSENQIANAKKCK